MDGSWRWNNFICNEERDSYRIFATMYINERERLFLSLRRGGVHILNVNELAHPAKIWFRFALGAEALKNEFGT